MHPPLKRGNTEILSFAPDLSNVIIKFRSALTASLASVGLSGLVDCFRCFAFIFCLVLIFIRYIGVRFMFGLLDCFRNNEDFIISRFSSIHFTVTLAGLNNIVPFFRGPLY